MTPLEYQRWCRRFDNHVDVGGPRPTSTALALGLCAEAGEVANEYERSRRQGRDGHLDARKVGIELGDVLWNVARLADELGYTLEDLFEMNINKLLARYEERGLEIK